MFGLCDAPALAINELQSFKTYTKYKQGFGYEFLTVDSKGETLLKIHLSGKDRYLFFMLLCWPAHA